MSAAAKKPAASEGQDSRPRLLIELGITSWTNVSNDQLEFWMCDRFTEEIRVMACCCRQSWGYQSAFCVRQTRDKKSGDLVTLPLSPADIPDLIYNVERKLGNPDPLRMKKQNVSRAMQKLIHDGVIRLEGKSHHKKIYFNPTPKPQPGRFKPEPEAGEEEENLPADPEQREAFLQFREVINSDYLRALQVIRSEKHRLLEVIRSEGALIGRKALKEKGESESQWVGGLSPLFEHILHLETTPPPSLPATPEKPEDLLQPLDVLEQYVRIWTERQERPESLQPIAEKLYKLSLQLAPNLGHTGAPPASGQNGNGHQHSADVLRLQNFCIDQVELGLFDKVPDTSYLQNVLEQLGGAPVEQLETYVRRNRNKALKYGSSFLHFAAQDCKKTWEAIAARGPRIEQLRARMTQARGEDNVLAAARAVLAHRDCEPNERAEILRALPALQLSERA